MKFPIGFKHEYEKECDLSHIQDEKSREVLESLDSFTDTYASCDWTHYCLVCGKEYCSGCTFECPKCKSLMVSFKGWTNNEIKNIIEEFPKQIITGNIFQWLRIKLWNLLHPKALEEC